MGSYSQIRIYVYLLLALSHHGGVEADTDACTPLPDPENGRILKCTSGSSKLSVCTPICDKGFQLHGAAKIMCWCGGGSCSWRGLTPSCKATKCDEPDFDEGKVRFVDKWPRGFAAVMELSNVPDLHTKLTSGWSMVLIFDKPLGQDSRISCWNADVLTTSHERQTFTLANTEHNSDLSVYLETSDIRWAFIVNGVEGDIPEAAYVGLFNHRVEDASCLKAPIMHKIDTIHVPRSAEEKMTTNQPETTRSLETTTPELTTRTTVITTKETVATTVPETTTQTPDTTTVQPTTVPTTVTSKPKRRRLLRRRRKLIKKTTTAPTTTTTATTQPMTEIVPSLIDFIDDTYDLVTGLPESATNDSDDLVMDKSGGRNCILQRAEGSYKTQDGWEDHGIPFFSGNAILDVKDHLLDWAMLLIFDSSIEEVQVWSVTLVDKSADGRMWTFGPHSWNLELYPGLSDINFIAKQAGRTGSTPVAKVYLCSYAFTEGDAIVISPDSQAQIAHENGELPTEATHIEEEEEQQSDKLDEVVENKKAEDPASGLKRWKKPTKIAKRCLSSSPNGIVPTTQGQIVLNIRPNNDGTKYNYNEVLHKSILFYEAQRAGRLPKNNRIPWRGDSTLKDGCDIGLDLSGGWFDAGDHVKFHFPMACSVTMLTWGGVLFRDAYKDAGEFERLLDSVKWPVNYLIRSHISKYEFVGQVGSGKIDHITYGRPEEMRMIRPTYIIDPENPGTELAAEAAAALASSHLFFKGNHPRLSRTCLKHAIELFEFADKFRGDYHNSIPDVKDFYFSYSGYNDELIWAAAWLYKATGNKDYMLKAKGLYLQLGGQYAIESEFSWDRKLIGAQILMANLTGEDIYRKPVETFLQNMLTAQATPKGLYWVRKWGPNRYAANVAYMVLAASTLTPPFPKMDVYVEWARKQIHLLLGDIGRSYVVGFGKNYPQRVHHRSSACKPFPAPCNRKTFYTAAPNYFVLHGGLVGGPDQKEAYTDNRVYYEQTEVACDYNAGFQGAVAGLKHMAMKKRKPTQTYLQNNLRKWFG